MPTLARLVIIEKNSPTSRSALQDVFQVANQHLRHQLQVDAFTDS